MKTILIICTIFLCSCASYVQSIHRQINNEQNQLRKSKYKQSRTKAKRYQLKNPVTLHGVPSANTTKNHYPHTKRQYHTKGTRRYSAKDLIDNQSDGSLWSGKNSDSFLFVNNNLKKKGDIIIVDVLKGLKDRIKDELKRAFPAPKKEKKKSAIQPENASTEPVTPTPNTNEAPNKVYDKISTSVVEQINQDYVLIRGRKEILYQKFKRYFEFQAIVSQKDISTRDTVNSQKLLETKINILRY